MSATEGMTDGGVALDGDARTARAMGEALQLLDRAWSQAQRVEDVARLREAFTCLAEAGQRVQEGAVDAAVWRHIGEAVLLADQVGRSPGL
jgi:hypothetical protein